MMTRQQASGFTLIELVIAVAILAILIGIAVPAYTQHVIKTNRAEGKARLLNTAQALERCFTRFNAYDAGDCVIATALEDGVESENGHYLITGTITATTFTLSAAPQDSQASRDRWCGTLTLQHTGARDMTGDAEWDSQRCWG